MPLRLIQLFLVILIHFCNTLIYVMHGVYKMTVLKITHSSQLVIRVIQGTIIYFCPLLIPFISKVNILLLLLSDHSPVITSLTPVSLGPRHNHWRFNTSLLQDGTFLQISGDSASNPQVLWETAKCFIRGKCISFSIFSKKHTEGRKIELEKKKKFTRKRIKRYIF